MTDAAHEPARFEYVFNGSFNSLANLEPAQIEQIVYRVEAVIGEVVAGASDIRLELAEHRQIDPALLLTPLDEWITSDRAGAKSQDIKIIKRQLAEEGLNDARAVLAMGEAGLEDVRLISGLRVGAIKRALAALDPRFELQRHRPPVEYITSLYESVSEVPIFVHFYRTLTGKRTIQDILDTPLEELAGLLAWKGYPPSQYLGYATEMMDSALDFARQFQAAKAATSK